MPRKRGDQIGDAPQITEEQEDALGRDIDRLDNLFHTTNLPMSAEFHLKQLRSGLPELIEDMKDHFADAFGWDPWKHHPDRRKRNTNVT